MSSQYPTTFIIAGRVSECLKIIFVDTNNNVTELVTSDYFMFFAHSLVPFDVIFITSNTLKDNTIIRNVYPIEFELPSNLWTNSFEILQLIASNGIVNMLENNTGDYITDNNGNYVYTRI